MECLHVFLANSVMKHVFWHVVCSTFQNPKSFRREFMKKRTCSQWVPIMLTLFLGVVLAGARLNALQQSPSPARQQQPPAQAPNQSGQQAPDSQADQQQPQGQIYAGTIKKAGDKYVLQDASGTTYDIDRQDLVKKYEGQKVRISGTLDPDGKTIHVK
jgi:uncharacterized protein YdeI (BOF family)